NGCELAERMVTMNRVSQEWRREHEETTRQRGGAASGSRVSVDGRKDCMDGQSCPNPKLAPEKSKIVAGQGSRGINSKGNKKGGAQGRGRTSFKDALGKSKGNNPGNQQYLVDIAVEILSMVIDGQEVEDYYQNLSRDAIIGRFNGIWPSSTTLYH
ncbi:hypothetical protein KI387_010764, partial [Taxus chinensis]